MESPPAGVSWLHSLLRPHKLPRCKWIIIYSAVSPVGGHLLCSQLFVVEKTAMNTFTFGHLNAIKPIHRVQFPFHINLLQ